MGIVSTPAWSLLTLSWGRQLQPYLAAVVTMKLIVILPLTLPKISNAIIRWGQSMLSWLPIDGQVIFVLAIFPVIMNVFQFCVMDQVIKAGKGTDPKDREHSDVDDDEEMGAEYEAIPTLDSEPAPGTPRRRNSSLRDVTKAMSRSSSVASIRRMSATEDHRLLAEGSSRGVSMPDIVNSVWASIRSPNTSKPTSSLLFSADQAQTGAETPFLTSEPDDIAMSQLGSDGSDRHREDRDDRRI